MLHIRATLSRDDSILAILEERRPAAPANRVVFLAAEARCPGIREQLRTHLAGAQLRTAANQIEDAAFSSLISAEAPHQFPTTRYGHWVAWAPGSTRCWKESIDSLPKGSLLVAYETWIEEEGRKAA